MRTIGITGGVGSGKSEILKYLEHNCNCRIEFADQIAQKLEMPNQPCYRKLISLLGSEILDENSMIDKKRMAEAIFSDQQKLKEVDKVVHPEVKKYIIGEIQKEKDIGKTDYFFLEAALLIEDGYEKIVDELWYVYADKEIRISRLQRNRGYSREKALHIICRQLSDQQFREHCSFVIDNSGNLKETFYQIDKKLEIMKNEK